MRNVEHLKSPRTERPAKASTNAFLNLRNATFKLGESDIFPGTNWHWRRSESWAVVGGNGSGKSLFLDALRGRLPLTAGSMTYCFRAPKGGVHEDAIGHVSFEDRRDNVHDTVVQSRWNSLEEAGAVRVREFLSYENILQINPYEVRPRNAELRERTLFEKKLKQVIRWLRLEPLMEQMLISVSNGEMQRVQIAHELCRPLRLLLLDEPFTGMDTDAKSRFRKMLCHLEESGIKVLVATAREEDLPEETGHLILLDDCRVSASGTREQILIDRNKARFDVSKKIRPSFVPNKPSHPANPKVPLVKLINVGVRYGGNIVLKNLNWIVNQGENWAVLGPNGSGKSTLLSLISGDHPQVHANQIEVLGRRLGTNTSVWSLKKRIGIVSPELHIHTDANLTCSEVVTSGLFDTVGLFSAPSGPERRQVLKTLAEFQLTSLADTPFGALSAGMQRLVLLGRAVVKQPRLLLLDEPCLGLDEPHRLRFMKSMDRLIKSKKVTVIYITHRMEELPSAIKWALVLKNGGGMVNRVSADRTFD